MIGDVEEFLKDSQEPEQETLDTWHEGIVVNITEAEEASKAGPVYYDPQDVPFI